MQKTARIAHRHLWAEGLVTLELDVMGPAFAPGQFFNLSLPAADGKVVRRSYSAASAPGRPLEFLISRVAEGQLTPQLCDLRPGDELLLDDAPLGFFTLAEVPPAQHLFLVATGTGLGPYLSMLRSGQDLARFKRIVVVHGVTEPARLVAHDELRARASLGELVYLPLTSRATPPSGGLPGRITTCLAEGQLERAAGVPIDESSHVLLCGNPHMIEDVAAQLKQRGLTKHRRRTPGHFNFEKYW